MKTLIHLLAINFILTNAVFARNECTVFIKDVFQMINIEDLLPNKLIENNFTPVLKENEARFVVTYHKAECFEWIGYPSPRKGDCEIARGVIQLVDSQTKQTWDILEYDSIGIFLEANVLKAFKRALKKLPECRL